VFDSHGHENLGCVLLDEGWMGILCFFGTEPIQADLFIFFVWLVESVRDVNMGWSNFLFGCLYDGVQAGYDDHHEIQNIEPMFLVGSSCHPLSTNPTLQNFGRDTIHTNTINQTHRIATLHGRTQQFRAPTRR
jgi:hypothetical protein